MAPEVTLPKGLIFLTGPWEMATFPACSSHMCSRMPSIPLRTRFRRRAAISRSPALSAPAPRLHPAGAAGGHGSHVDSCFGERAAFGRCEKGGGIKPGRRPDPRPAWGRVRPRAAAPGAWGSTAPVPRATRRARPGSASSSPSAPSESTVFLAQPRLISATRGARDSVTPKPPTRQ